MISAAPLASVVHLAGRGMRWALGDRSPLVASLKLTARCNLGCAHCPWVEARPTELPYADWLRIVEALARRGVRYLVLEGGEPLLRTDLAALITAGHEHGMRVTVATNGIKPLGHLDPDRFLVSVDGLESTHDKMRGQGSYARMVDNLPTARAPVVALVSLWQGNYDEIERLVETLAGHVAGFWFSFVYDYGGRARLGLSNADKRLAAQRVLSLAGRYPVFNTRTFLQRVGSRRPCRPWLLVTVTADGQEKPGCVIGALEASDCDQCELACHRELSDLVEPRFVIDQLRTQLRKSWI